MNPCRFIPLYFALAVSSVWADGRVVCTWEAQTVGQAPPPLFDRTATATKGAVLRVVNGASEPPSPFPNGKAALHVQSPEGSRAAVSTVLAETPSPKGWAEFDVAAGTKNMVIDLIQRPAGSENPRGFRTNGKTLALVFIRPNDSLLVMTPDRAAKMNFFPKIPENTPVTVRVDWDLSASPPVLSFKIDGAQVTDGKGESVNFALPHLEEATGIDVVRISPDDAFVGEIRASD
jgi:hypothetical protein